MKQGSEIRIYRTVENGIGNTAQGAMNWVHDYHKELESKFIDLYENKIPKFGEPVDAELARYVNGIGNWV